MGQLIIPTTRTINGPWFIDSNSLELLNETIEKIESKLEEAYNSLADRTAEAKISEYKRWDKDIDLEAAKLKVRGSYPFDDNEKYVLITSAQGDKIKDDSLILLLKDRKLDQFEPIELDIQIKKGPCEFILEIGASGGELRVRTKVHDDNIFSDINYELNKWIEKNKPNIALEKWSSWFPVFGFPIIFLLTLMTLFLTKSTSDIYKTKLKQESHELLKNGLEEKELSKAVQILLENESNYVPENFSPSTQTNKTVFNIWLAALVILIILFIRPRTVIGLGKNKWKVIFYRRWTYFVLVFIPLSILFPIIMSKIF
jgi:hypothetical protein